MTEQRAHQRDSYLINYLQLQTGQTYLKMYKTIEQEASDQSRISSKLNTPCLANASVNIEDAAELPGVWVSWLPPGGLPSLACKLPSDLAYEGRSCVLKKPVLLPKSLHFGTLPKMRWLIFPGTLKRLLSLILMTHLLSWALPRIATRTRKAKSRNPSMEIAWMRLGSH